jgi:excisionase family DNA binding protein
MQQLTKEDIECLTIHEVTALLKIDNETVYRLARAGKIPAFKLNNGRWRFPLKKVKAFIEGRMNNNLKFRRYNPETEKYEYVCDDLWK